MTESARDEALRLAMQVGFSVGEFPLEEDQRIIWRISDVERLIALVRQQVHPVERLTNEQIDSLWDPSSESGHSPSRYEIARRIEDAVFPMIGMAIINQSALMGLLESAQKARQRPGWVWAKRELSIEELEECRQEYETTYHKVKARIGFDDWQQIWASLPVIPTHPDSQAWKWGDLELRAWKDYRRSCAAMLAAAPKPGEPTQDARGKSAVQGLVAVGVVPNAPKPGEGA
jgi:hypothetical protein